MANEEKLHQLAQRLLTSTREEKTKWEPQTDYWFQLALPSGVVSVASDHGTEPHVLAVYNANGTLIESLRTYYSAGQWEPEAAPWNETLGELYEAARNNALDIEGVIDSILDDVEPQDEEVRTS